MRKLQIVIGILLALGAAAAVLVLGRMTRPTTFDVAVVTEQVPAFTPLSTDLVSVDTQAVSPAVADKYVLADELDAMLDEGAVIVENLHPGQPLMREQVATAADGDDVAHLSRLAVALKDPDRVILSIPAGRDDVPGVAPGDVVGLFYTAGNVRAGSLVTETVEEPEGAPDVITGTETIPWRERSRSAEASEPVTVTTELEMPLAKWIANGIVYRLNQERRENPNYGAPGMGDEPRYIEGELAALDIVVHRADAEWVAFALAHGDVQIGVLPAVVKDHVEAGALAPARGVTWTDFEAQFFAEREEAGDK